MIAVLASGRTDAGNKAAKTEGVKQEAEEDVRDDRGC
jgi:hypothetical protein